MDQELAALIARAEAIAATGERFSADFAVELAQVWLNVERALRTVVGTLKPPLELLALRDTVRRTLTQAGYDGLVAIVSREALDAVQTVLLPAARAELVASASTQLAALRELAERTTLSGMTTQAQVVAEEIWRAVSLQVIAHRPVEEIVAALADTLDRSQSSIRTLFDTAVSMYGRQVEAVATEALGPGQPFLYAGPIDDVTRDWCLQRVGKVFTRAEIDAMDNGQLPDVFVSGGGWNCRHSFLAVESQALRSLAGTGERVEPIAADVARIRERKAIIAALKHRRKAA